MVPLFDLKVYGAQRLQEAGSFTCMKHLDEGRLAEMDEWGALVFDSVFLSLLPICF